MRATDRLRTLAAKRTPAVFDGDPVTLVGVSGKRARIQYPNNHRYTVPLADLTIHDPDPLTQDQRRTRANTRNTPHQEGTQ